MFEEELDKGSGSSWLGLVLSALINVRCRRDFCFRVRYLANLQYLLLFLMVQLLTPVFLYCLQRKVFAFCSLGSLRAGATSAVVCLYSPPGNLRCILAAIAGGGNTSLGCVCSFSSWFLQIRRCLELARPCEMGKRWELRKIFQDTLAPYFLCRLCERTQFPQELRPDKHVVHSSALSSHHC